MHTNNLNLEFKCFVRTTPLLCANSSYVQNKWADFDLSTRLHENVFVFFKDIFSSECTAVKRIFYLTF